MALPKLSRLKHLSPTLASKQLKLCLTVAGLGFGASQLSSVWDQYKKWLKGKPEVGVKAGATVVANAKHRENKFWSMGV